MSTTTQKPKIQSIPQKPKIQSTPQKPESQSAKETNDRVSKGQTIIANSLRFNQF